MLLSSKRGLNPAVFGFSIVTAIIIIWNPKAALYAAVGFSLICHGLYFSSSLQKLFIRSLGILLVGYAFLGKSFAYIKFPHLYIGEVVLSFGLMAVFVDGRTRAIIHSPLFRLIILFSFWGVVNTFPYFGSYGFDALRDGVSWGYCIFAIFVPGFLSNSKRIFEVTEYYYRLVPYYLLWIPVGYFIIHSAGPQLPVWPNSLVPLISLKHGDVAVHLSGIAVFRLLLLHEDSIKKLHLGLKLKKWCWWAIWIAGFFIAGSLNRGGLLSVIAAVLVALAFRSLKKWRTVYLLCFGIIAVFVTFNLKFQMGSYRETSPQQIVKNIQSVFGSDNINLEGTRQYRLRWWKDIINYTIFGDYFWTGKGYGINLAESDGYQLLVYPPLRSPHNTHITFLARSGMPGLLLWLFLQGTFAISLIRAYYRSCRNGQERWAKIILWILSYWTAFMVNATFDVFLEGPMGGIWFWSLFGFGIAALQIQRLQLDNISEEARLRSS